MDRVHLNSLSFAMFSNATWIPLIWSACSSLSLCVKTKRHAIGQCCEKKRLCSNSWGGEGCVKIFQSNFLELEQVFDGWWEIWSLVTWGMKWKRSREKNEMKQFEREKMKWNKSREKMKWNRLRDNLKWNRYGRRWGSDLVTRTDPEPLSTGVLYKSSDGSRQNKRAKLDRCNSQKHYPTWQVGARRCYCIWRAGGV